MSVVDQLSTPVVNVAASPRLDRLRRWIGIFSAYFTAQTTTQLLGIAAGILFIRYMPVGEFALYTLAASVATFLAFLTDLGSTSSLVHFFQRSARDATPFRTYRHAVLSLRWMGFAVAGPLVLIGFPMLAMDRGFAFSDALLCGLAVVLGAALQIGATVRVLSLRLHDRYGHSYRSELAGAATRLTLAGGMVVTTLLHSWLGLLTNGLGSAVTSWLAREKSEPRRLATGAAEEHPSGDVDLSTCRRAVLRYLLPTLPSALYFSIQGPLVVWLAAAYGGSQNIAEVGALTRLGLIVGTFSGLTGVVFLPRLARLADERLWRRRALQFGAVHLVIATTLLALAWLEPRGFLWILGEQYSGLHEELLLVVATSGIALVSGYVVSLNMSRAWNRWQGAAALLLFLGQAAMVSRLGLHTTLGLLTFNLLSAGLGLLLQLLIFGGGNTRQTWVETT
jgi:O-antigen/teichoic acid export membrane protein